MGHFYETITGKGKTKAEAQSNAVDEFLQENGRRHSVRDVTHAKFIKRVPPMGVIRKEGSTTIHDFTRPNTDAPQSEWLEVWTFELHTHA